jgi:CheY-like chemotaxis protein
VEDESAILSLVSKMLTALGYSVLQAGTPIEAMDLVRKHTGRIDLLLTDVVMPEMNGRDLSNRLLHRHPRLKRLFMSGYTADIIARHGVLDDGVNFIQKPFTMQDLAGKLSQVLGGRKK